MNTEERVKFRTEFKESLKSFSKEELEAKLKEIGEESKELDDTVSKKEFKLPEKHTAAFEAIRYFLDKQKVKWNYALGLITIYEFFMKKQQTISYAMLDTVLRMLGQLEFEGYEEWKKVVLINDYFKPIAEEYRDITDTILDTAERYAMVDQSLSLFDKQPSNEPHEVGLQDKRN